MKMEAKKVYDEILNLVKRYNDLIVFDLSDLERKAKAHLFGIELKEKYGLNINPKYVTRHNFYNPKDGMHICMYGEKHNRTISWSVDGRQPEDEMLLSISFSTGAYIFGDDYPTEFFKRFWLELKTFNPKYTDEANHSLYFDLENAKDIFNQYDSVFNKYRELNKEDRKQRQIEKLKKDLEKLQS